MRLWTLTPVLAVLVWATHTGLGYGAAGNPEKTSADGLRVVLVADFIPAAARQGPSPSPSPASLAPVSASTTPVLQQVNGGTWQTTVLVTGAAGGCPTTASRYSLDTTSPDMVIGPDSNPTSKPTMINQMGVPAESCEVRLTFTGLNQIPATATLVIDGASALPLAVSRNIGYLVPIGVPVGAGVVLAIALLFWTLWYLRVYDRLSVQQKPFVKRPPPASGRRRSFNQGFWHHEVYASGAWTLTDSWATNIAAAIGLITVILSLIPATDLLFRGVALDRFAVMNAIAAGIAAAAPLVFAVLYAHRLRMQPGVTGDAELNVPAVTWPGSIVQLAGPSAMMLAAGTLITIDPAALPAEYRPANDKKADGKKLAPQRMRVRLAEPAAANLAPPAEATPARREWIVLTPAQAAPAVTFPGGARVSLPGGLYARLTPEATASLPVGAAARICASDWDNLLATIPDQADHPKRLGEISRGPRTDICASSGATITVPWGATACHQSREHPRACHVQADSKIQIPACSRISIMARKIALPGGSDVTVHGTSVLRIGSPDPAVTLFTIPGSDITTSHDDPSDDLDLPYPVYIMPAAGAKITVNGMAHVTVPAGLRVTAPYRDNFCLSPERTHFQLPQGADSLAGTVIMVIVAALVTMFGIGAQIGIAATLVGLSQANVLGRAIMGLLLLGAMAFTLRYSVTAIGALVDPQPGSTMSTTAGTSFTL